MNENEHNRFQENMKLTNGKSLSGHILKLAMAQLVGIRVVQKNDLINENLIKELRRIGNKINQIVMKLHRQMRIKATNGMWNDSIQRLTKIVVGYELLIEQVESLEKVVKGSVTSRSKSLLDQGEFWEMIKLDEEKLRKTIRHLTEHLKNQIQINANN